MAAFERDHRLLGVETSCSCHRRQWQQPVQSRHIISCLETDLEGYRLVFARVSTSAPTATACFSIVLNVGRLHTPLSRRETTLLVVQILVATSSFVIPAAARAATRSDTSPCSVRSALSNRRARVFLRSRCVVSRSRFPARNGERSHGRLGHRAGWLARMLTPPGNHADLPFG
jgi:hypothetical protein